MWRVTQYLKVAGNSYTLRPQSRSAQILTAVTKRQKCSAEAESLDIQYIHLVRSFRGLLYVIYIHFSSTDILLNSKAYYELGIPKIH